MPLSFVDIVTSTESIKQKYGTAILCLSNTEKVGASRHFIIAAAGVVLHESSVQCLPDSHHKNHIDDDDNKSMEQRSSYEADNFSATH
jgi:hypothetical protein